MLYDAQSSGTLHNATCAMRKEGRSSPSTDAPSLLSALVFLETFLPDGGSLYAYRDEVGAT
eukprot:scaffold625_cov324-Pavlova_lutheri.AAC.22